LIPLPILTRFNYHHTWRKQATAVLLEKRIWSVIDEPELKSEDPVSTKLDMYGALGLLHRMVHIGLYSMLLEKSSPKKIWEFLEETFSKKPLNLHGLLSSFHNSLFPSDNNIHTHINNVRNAAQQLVAAGTKIDDHALLQHPPPKCDIIKQMIRHDDSLTFDQRVTRLIEDKNQKSQQNASSSSYHVRPSRPVSMNYICNSCGGRGHLP